MHMSENGRILVGTSGWSYPTGEGTWKGHFYPRGAKNELEYYSRFFNTVEVNSSFYRPPAPAVTAAWARKTPPGFCFSVKLWQKFTHPKIYRQATGEVAAVSPEDVRLFEEGLQPLVRAGKLAALLAQFPPSFTNDDIGRQILQATIDTFGSYNLAVELRHCSWSDDPSVADMLRENGICWVQIDEPKFSFSIASDTPVTSQMAYFRFHGRNTEMWWKGNVESRYRYLYSPAEISQLAERVKTASRQANHALVYFNNHWQAFAPRNATDLLRALQIPLKELPMPEEDQVDQSK
jgi:uncharacterized protein YecE (DUF72 family)